MAISDQKHNPKNPLNPMNPGSDLISEKFSEITGKIIGCSMRVHSTLGTGFQEVIYQRALGIEFELAGLGYMREFEMPIFYREKQVGSRRVDFLVENVIVVELKAISELEPLHLAQGINYLEAYNLEIGLLINFGSKSLTFKRLLNRRYFANSLKIKS